MIPPDASEFHAQMQASWEALGEGAPTLAALAAVCAGAIVSPTGQSVESLRDEARAILFAAKDRGVIEVRGVRTAFEGPARLLAVYVELDEHRTIAFRNREAPEVTVRFFEGFCQLCRAGLVLHHLHRDFSLSHAGFEKAGQIEKREVERLLAEATEFGLHD